MRNARSKTLCLNMIVKNEMVNLERCLGAVAPYIACWVIGDTGSTDGTQEFIRSFFAMRDIPGELHSFPFVDFAQARNEALNRARASKLRFDYLLLTDADMELKIHVPTFSEGLTSAAYKVLQRSGVAYWNNRLLRRNVPASYKGVTHEYLDVRAGKTRNLQDISFVDHATGSNRVDKYERDVRLLTKAITTERDAGMIARYTFYLANTLRDSGQREAALKTYIERARLDNWSQEVFVSLLNAAKLKEALKYSNDEVVSAYMEASAACPTRAEALHGAARFCRDKGIYGRGYEFAVQGLAVTYPSDALFVEDWIYEYGLLDELAVNAYWTGRYTECVDACERLLSGGQLPAHHCDRVLKNKQSAIGKLGEVAAPAAALNIPNAESEAEASHRPSAATQSGDPSTICTRRALLPYAVRRAADHCPDISIENITRRIGYASYVNVERRYMYYQVSKAGCTSMKWLLHSLERLPPINYFGSRQRESRRDMFIHERSNLQIPSLLDFDDATQEFVLTSPEFLRFTVIRNPYTRTESAWKDKVRLCAPTYEKYYQAIRGSLPTDHAFSVPPVTFREFVESISQEDLVNSDPHWRLQVAQTLRGALNLSYIGRLEEYSEAIRVFHAHLGENPPQPPTNFNRTVGASHYDEAIATMVYELYRQDFETFGYDQNSWIRPSKEPSPVVPEAVFVDEVLERNIVISHLYEGRDALERRVQELEIDLREKEQSRETDDNVTAMRSGRPAEAGSLMTLLEAAWQEGELAHPNDEFIAANVDAASSCAAPAKALHEAARFCREKGMYDASALFCEAGFALASPEKDTLLRNGFAATAGLQEEFSIAANYSSDPARKDRGFASCNWLALSREVTNGSRDLARWNLFFYIKAAGEVLPSFNARPIGFKPPDGFQGMNPSVARQGDNVFVTQRCVNSTVTDDGNYEMPDGDLPHTRNYLLRLNDELDIQSAAEILPPVDMPVASSTRLSDPRLFAWQDALWCVAGVRDLIEPGRYEQMLARIDQDASEQCRLSDWRVLRPDGRRQHEQNWMPQILGERLRFVYLCDPTRMLDDQARTTAETPSPVAADEFRGGTQAIGFDGGWLTLIHEVSVRDQRRYYWHRFVWFDSDDALRRVSRPIYFQHKGIEFAAGLAWHPGGKLLLVSYGVRDCESWIATVDADEVRGVLEDTEQLPWGILGKDGFGSTTSVDAGIRTFDLFDTLIARRDPDPQAVFRAVERRGGHTGFAAMRRTAETQIFGAPYTLDDIYARLTTSFDVGAEVAGRLMALEVAIEEESIVPIVENLRLLGPNDVIVSDMYHSEDVLRGILQRTCNVIPGRLIVSSHGKRSGRVWQELLAAGPIIEHLGDNPVTDDASAKAAGIPVRLTTIARRTAGESELADHGFAPLANLVREARLGTWSDDLGIRQAQLAQIEVNFPLIFLANLHLLRRAREAGWDNILFSARDCFLWSRLYDDVRRRLTGAPWASYFYTGRVTRAHPSADYLDYFTRLRAGRRNVVVDLCGTGWSLSRLVEHSPKPPTDIFLLHQLDLPNLVQRYSSHGNLNGPMTVEAVVRRAPKSGDNDVLEDLNRAPHAAVEDMRREGDDFVPVLSTLDYDAAAAALIRAHHTAFNACCRLVDGIPANALIAMGQHVTADVIARTYARMGDRMLRQVGLLQSHKLREEPLVWDRLRARAKIRNDAVTTTPTVGERVDLIEAARSHKSTVSDKNPIEGWESECQPLDDYEFTRD